MTFIEGCKKKHTLVLATGLNKQPEAVIRKAGLYDEIGSGNFFFEFDEAIKYARSIIDVLNSGHKKHKQIKAISLSKSQLQAPRLVFLWVL